MEYNHFKQQDLTNAGALHAQEYTHMNDTVFLLCPELKQNIRI